MAAFEPNNETHAGRIGSLNQGKGSLTLTVSDRIEQKTARIAVVGQGEAFRWADAALILTNHRECDYTMPVYSVPLIVRVISRR